jgi:hypothetical protein
MGRAAPVSRMIVRTLSGTDAAIDWIAYRKSPTRARYYMPDDIHIGREGAFKTVCYIGAASPSPCACTFPATPALTRKLDRSAYITRPLAVAVLATCVRGGRWFACTAPSASDIWQARAVNAAAASHQNDEDEERPLKEAV